METNFSKERKKALNTNRVDKMRKLKLTSGTKTNVLVKRVDFEQENFNQLRKRSHGEASC